jgi:Ca2+-binding RTX toxin-like protein
VVDSTADSVIEIANEGTDLVQSSVSIMLPMNIENLILLGNTVMTAMGNDSNNVMTGNTADNTLDGGAGNDTLIGGLGNDTYVVDSSADFIIENVNEGTDLAQSSVNFTLPTNIENLNLVGNSAITGTGNLSNNIMIGNTADNTLDGGLGSDTLIGGLGNDLYIVDNLADFLTENANQGIDTVQSSVSYTLNSNIENLTLIGDLGNTGIGNALDNILTGNSASNTLSGLGGHDTIYGMGGDTLIGGFGADRLIAEGDKNTLQGDAGNDTFVFSNFLFTNNTIVDFVKGDRIEIEGYGAVNTIVSGTGDNVKQGVIEYSLDGINTII